MDLPRKLLRMAAAVDADGGDEVVRILGAILKESAPFDAGEVAVLTAVGFERWTLTDDDDAVAAEDLLLHVTQRREPVRLDHAGPMAQFPRTLERMSRRALQSLLALPLSAPGSSEGAVVLARRHGWAFVGAPLNAFLQLAAMAGLCLKRARMLTALRSQVDALKGGGQFADREREAVRGELAAARAESAAVRLSAGQERRRLGEELERQRTEISRLATELEAARRGLATAQPQPLLPGLAPASRRRRSRPASPAAAAKAPEPSDRRHS